MSKNTRLRHEARPDEASGMAPMGASHVSRDGVTIPGLPGGSLRRDGADRFRLDWKVGSGSRRSFTGSYRSMRRALAAVDCDPDVAFDALFGSGRQEFTVRTGAPPTRFAVTHRGRGLLVRDAFVTFTEHAKQRLGQRSISRAYAALAVSHIEPTARAMAHKLTVKSHGDEDIRWVFPDYRLVVVAKPVTGGPMYNGWRVMTAWSTSA